jgi:hypothetical protein
MVLVGMGLWDQDAQLRAGTISLGDPSPLAAFSFSDSEPAAASMSAADEAPSPQPQHAVLRDAVPLPELYPAANSAGSTPPPRPLTGSLAGAGLPVEAKRPASELITRLAPCEETILPDPIPSSIFHPPRRLSQG